MNKPKVLVIGPTPPPYNGMSVATELVLNALGDEFHLIHLDTADRRGLSNIGRIDLRNVLLAAYHGLQCLWLLLLKNPKIVYVPIAQDRLAFLRDSLFLIPARLLGKKVVVHLHGAHFANFYRFASAPTKRLIRYCLGASDRAIVLGASLSGMFEGILPRERVRVIANGIPDTFAGKRCPPNGHRRTMLFLSTLMKEKGTLDVLAAIPAIAERVPDVQVIFAGEWFRPANRSAAQETITSLGLAAHVKFVGPVSPPFKYDLLAQADVFVLPSYNEGQPYAVLEAMAAGLPVISSSVGCIPETVIDGLNGFIVKPGNREEFAGRVVSILSNDNLRKTMGEASRRRFLEQYTLDRFSTQMKNLFREVATEPALCPPQLV
ncbi:MAG: glycosyltransferase family 4 protein [Candidatus Sulfotelmatobacter sp.]